MLAHFAEREEFGDSKRLNSSIPPEFCCSPANPVVTRRPEKSPGSNGLLESVSRFHKTRACAVGSRGLFPRVFPRPRRAKGHRLTTIFPGKTVMARHGIGKQRIMNTRKEDLSDKRAFLSDKSKNNRFLFLCYSRVFITFASDYRFLRENGNVCLTKALLQILCDYFVRLVDS